MSDFYDSNSSLEAVYTILGVNLNGKKDVLDLYIFGNKGANFWLQVLTDLSSRGLIACIDGRKGFPEVIPDTEIPHCIVHQILNSLKDVALKNQQKFMADLKRIYQASTRDIAEVELNNLEEKWDKNIL